MFLPDEVTDCSIGQPQFMCVGANTDRSWINAALGEEIPFVFGAPFLRGGYSLFPYNFTSDDQLISEAVIKYWSNFASCG